MDIKGSTKTYADRKDTNFITKESDTKNYSASEMKKLGKENVGDFLNQIADPQWVDPAKKMRTVGNKNLDKDAFMKLMLTQMKHQDPTNPMQAHEMASQLAAFTSVEQLQNLNTTMEGLKKAQAPMQQFEALNFIGKSVAGDSSTLTRTKGDTSHDFQYKLLKEAETVKLSIKNIQGEVVREFSVKNAKAGANSIDWNGQNERGIEQPPGEYFLSVEATDVAGQKVGVETRFDGLITGVNYTPEGPLLLVGQRTIKMSDVKKIVDPNIKNEGQKIEKNINQDLKLNPNPQETKEASKVKEASSSSANNNTAPTMPLASNLGQLSMDRGMLNKVETGTGKELAP